MTGFGNDYVGTTELPFVKARPAGYSARGRALGAVVAQQLYTLWVGGSNPSAPTIFLLRYAGLAASAASSTTTPSRAISTLSGDFCRATNARAWAII